MLNLRKNHDLLPIKIPKVRLSVLFIDGHCPINKGITRKMSQISSTLLESANCRFQLILEEIWSQTPVLSREEQDLSWDVTRSLYYYPLAPKPSFHLTHALYANRQFGRKNLMLGKCFAKNLFIYVWIHSYLKIFKKNLL